MRNRGEPGALAVLLIVTLALAPAGAARASLEIVGPAEVEERFVVRRGGETILVVDGREWELVTDPCSPAVSPLGDGSFHPMDGATVRAAVNGIRSALPVSGRILVLPYPRRSTLKSSCEGTDVFLSPGIREVAREHVHATVVHELGHLIQHERFVEGSSAWTEYLRRRSLDPERFHPRAAHRDRPREIFAEDFRFLFGGPLATSSGSIENPSLPLPSEIPGLRTWFEDVLRRSPGPLDRGRPEVSPNPFRAGAAAGARVRFRGAGPGPFHADVYDVVGRRVGSATGSRGDSDVVEFLWDGRTATGRRVSSGTYFVRWRGHDAAGTARVQILR